jgi:pyruvate kinase
MVPVLQLNLDIEGISLMTLPDHKTKIVCTLGPATENREILEKMLRAGMDIARLNFSHGDFESHSRMVEALLTASRNAGRQVSIMADLPGPKIRIGHLAEESVTVSPGSVLTLTTEAIQGTADRISVNFPDLPRVVKSGDALFLNDGYIQLEAIGTGKTYVTCRVVVGGELRSGKGLNFPGIRLGISAFTGNDRRCLEFALELGVDAVCQSFVETAEDVEAVRRAAAELGKSPFVIAKIERSRALENIESILEAADGILIGRGDLGVEIPIEQIAIVQKRLMHLANRAGKPVITATHMLESMIFHNRPTRAEATDVANAILDGTDCVMLSGESAMGHFPVESVAMLSRIAAITEPQIPISFGRDTAWTPDGKRIVNPRDLIALSMERMMEHVTPAALLIPTRSGSTARNIARYRLPCWITAVSSQASTCRNLQFSYGVYAIHEEDHPEDWRRYAGNWLDSNGIARGLVLLIEGPSVKNPDSNHRLEIIDMNR